jgi:ribosomal protein L24
MVGKDKGKQGNVIAYVKELNAVFVSGLNLVKKTYFHVFKLRRFYS